MTAARPVCPRPGALPGGGEMDGLLAAPTAPTQGRATASGSGVPLLCVPCAAAHGLLSGLVSGLGPGVAEALLQLLRLFCVLFFVPFMVLRSLLLVALLLLSGLLSLAQHLLIALFYAPQLLCVGLAAAATGALTLVVLLCCIVARLAFCTSLIQLAGWTLAGLACGMAAALVYVMDYVPGACLGFSCGVGAVFVAIADRAPCAVAAVFVAFAAILADMGQCEDHGLYRQANKTARSRISQCCGEFDPSKWLWSRAESLCMHCTSSLCCDQTPGSRMCQLTSDAFKAAGRHGGLLCMKCQPGGIAGLPDDHGQRSREAVEKAAARFSKVWEGDWGTGRAVDRCYSGGWDVIRFLWESVLTALTSRAGSICGDGWVAAHSRLRSEQGIAAAHARGIAPEPPEDPEGTTGFCSRASAASGACFGVCAARALRSTPDLCRRLSTFLGTTAPRKLRGGGDRVAHGVLRCCGFSDLHFWLPFVEAGGGLLTGEEVLFQGRRCRVAQPVAAPGAADVHDPGAQVVLTSSSRGGITCRAAASDVLVLVQEDTPVATFRIRHRLVARLLALVGGLGGILLISPAAVRRAIQAGGCDRWVLASLSAVVNAGAVLVFVLATVAAALAVALEAFLRGVGSALAAGFVLFVICGNLLCAVLERCVRAPLSAAAGVGGVIAVAATAALWIFERAFRVVISAAAGAVGVLFTAGAVLSVVATVVFTPPACAFGVCLMLFAAVVLGLLGLAYGSPFIGTLMKALAACFTCGSVEADFAKWGIGAMSEYVADFSRPPRNCISRICECFKSVMKSALTDCQWIPRAAERIPEWSRRAWECAPLCARPTRVASRARTWPSVVWNLRYCLSYCLTDPRGLLNALCGLPWVAGISEEFGPRDVPPTVHIGVFLGERSAVLRNILCLAWGCCARARDPTRPLPEGDCPWVLTYRGEMMPTGGLLLVQHRAAHYSDRAVPPSAPPLEWAPSAPTLQQLQPAPSAPAFMLADPAEQHRRGGQAMYVSGQAPRAGDVFVIPGPAPPPSPSAPPLPGYGGGGGDDWSEESEPCAPADMPGAPVAADRSGILPLLPEDELARTRGAAPAASAQPEATQYRAPRAPSLGPDEAGDPGASQTFSGPFSAGPRASLLGPAVSRSFGHGAAAVVPGGSLGPAAAELLLAPGRRRQGSSPRDAGRVTPPRRNTPPRTRTPSPQSHTIVEL
eukprot:TRINITY_DN9063_c0_g2_i1.p1 TRINITY_DN9063_c0_g2~~TRINITY_DN9063_c0_g2_i1.p1  ORF type:complete len:1199 (+),score=207.59 TRINITY_DN9063_c0_g2_i1:45-3641(+)